MIRHDDLSAAPMKKWLIPEPPRWVIAPLFLAIVVAWVVAPVYTVNAAPAVVPKQGVKTSLEKAAGDAGADIQGVKERLRELEDKERQDYALALEGQRKTMDWWFSFLAVLTAIMAIGGALIPFLMGRKDKEIIEQDKIQIKQLLAEVMGMKADAKQSVENIHQHEAEAAEAKKTLLSYQSGTHSSDGDEKIRDAVATIEQVKGSDYLLRLRAEAIDASQNKNTGKAYALWAALVELAPHDEVAQFNAGYWAGELANNVQGTEKLYWLGMAGKYYSQALNTASDMHEAAYNWGIALATEASVLSATELVAARERWKLAGEKYQLALCIKPSCYEASNNWGAALDAEARVLAATELDAARVLWKQSGEKYQQALSINPKDYELAFNWGDSLDAEASALATTEPDIACALWSQAGEKFQLALKIKPDDYDSIDSWGGVLIAEASILVESDAEGSRKLLNDAEQLLLAHADAAPGQFAYNLACVYGLRGDVLACLKWLNICKSHQKLESCEYMRKDKDLDAVRNDPAFVEWFKQVCP